VRQVITQHAFNEDKDNGWVDLDVSLVVVVRLDRQHVVAQAETEIGLAQSGTEQRDLCYAREWPLLQAHCKRQTGFVMVIAKNLCCGVDG
jgi:hypothetical protein